MAGTKKTSKRAAGRDELPADWTAEERAAMKERAKELKASAKNADGERDLLEKIAEMPDTDRIMAEKIHAIVKTTAADLVPKTWYGMPAYAKDGKVLCFFQAADKFKARYATFGFNDSANLDQGDDVADIVRAEGADAWRREEDRRARQESRDLSACDR